MEAQMIRYLRPCLWALAILWKERGIPRADRLRLFIKSVKLFLSFLAFTDQERSKRQLQAAMTGAELSATYDWDTDLRPVEALADSVYLRQLPDFVPDGAIRAPAQDLFVRDLTGELSLDGLERGSVALEFYRRLINSRWLRAYTTEEVAYFGRCLQILDDALDLVKDRLNGEKNCLLRERRHEYLAELERFVDDFFFAKLMNNSRIYRYLQRRWLEVGRSMQIHRRDSAMMTINTESPFDARAAAEVADEIRAHMNGTRPAKYEPWFTGIGIFKRIARVGQRVSRLPLLSFFEDGGRRAEGFDFTYLAAHYVDDVADGDMAVPKGFSSAVEYLEYMEHVVSGVEEPREAGGRLLMYGLQLLLETKANLQSEILDILAALKFDATRRSQGTLVAYPRESLRHHADIRDIRGTIGGCLKVMREVWITVRDLESLGHAIQIRYAIRDIRHDVLKCMLNIPSEDIERLGIGMPEDCTSEVSVRKWSDSASVRQWCVEQAEEGMRLLLEHHARKAKLRMHPFTRTVLFRMYEQPAAAFFQKILRTG